MTQELYALGSGRSAELVKSFLARFLPDRQSALVEYPVPELSDTPVHIFETEDEILAYLERHADEPYGLYWNDASATSRQAMVFYLRDGGAVFGLAEFSTSPNDRLRELASFVEASHWMLGSEERPPDTSAEFIRHCEAATAEWAENRVKADTEE
jgi:hypothetical protein